MPRAGPATTERAIAFPVGRRKPTSSSPLRRESLGARALRAESVNGDITWVASGLCAISTIVLFPHFAQRKCKRERPTNCAAGKECWAPQLEQAAFIASRVPVRGNFHLGLENDTIVHPAVYPRQIEHTPDDFSRR